MAEGGMRMKVGKSEFIMTQGMTLRGKSRIGLRT